MKSSSLKGENEGPTRKSSESKLRADSELGGREETHRRVEMGCSHGVHSPGDRGRQPRHPVRATPSTDECAAPMTLGRMDGLGLPGTITEIFAAD